MQEVTGSSPVSPTTSERDDRDTPVADAPREPGRAANPAADDDPGTTRERPANRSGIRPLARPRGRDADRRRERGWNRGRIDLSSCMDERFRDSWRTSDGRRAEERGRRRPSRRGRRRDRADEALFEAPERGSADELLDAGAHSELDAMRHSTAHVMAEAVLDLFPGTQLGIGPAIADGFYYDFKLDRPLVPADLEKIEARMAASVAADHPFVRRELPPDEGRALFAERDQPFKVEILDDLAAKAAAAGDADAADDVLSSTARSSTCARDRTSDHGEDRAVQAARASPARTGAATRSGRSSSGSTARSGRARRSSTRTSGGGRRRRSATIAGSASRSTCTASTTSRPARRSGIRRAR